MNNPLSALKAAWEVLRTHGQPNRKLWIMLASYYVLTPLSAAADGVAWLQLVRLFAPGVAVNTGFLTPLLQSLPTPSPASVGALFLAKAALLAGLTFIETAMGGYLRRKLQTASFERIAFGRWDALSGQQVGRWTGSLTEEAALMTKLVCAAFTALYALLTAGMLALMAVATAPSMAVTLAVVGIPAYALLRSVYGLQTRFSRSQAEARQGLAADLNETLSGLFQAKASGEETELTRRALRRQAEVLRRELQLGGTLSLLASFNPLVMGLALLGMAAWGGTAALAALGGVGVLASRAAAQVNGLVNAVGNLTRLSGSIAPMRELAGIPSAPAREPLGERLAGARLENVSYAHGGRRVLDGVTLEVAPGRLLLVTGPSGAGKTTLVNLLAGLYSPESGRVVYKGASGAEHDAARFRARIAYVAQDVHLFSGTVRENLDAAGRRDDDALWRCLERAGAADFVRLRGGLEAVLSEAGRSLSGGERRRLAVARALAQEADLLALDEVTNGLDEASKASLVASITALARELPVVAVTHDAAAFASAEPRSFVLAAAAR